MRPKLMHSTAAPSIASDASLSHSPASSSSNPRTPNTRATDTALSSCKINGTAKIVAAPVYRAAHPPYEPEDGAGNPPGLGAATSVVKCRRDAAYKIAQETPTVKRRSDPYCQCSSLPKFQKASRATANAMAPYPQ